MVFKLLIKRITTQLGLSKFDIAPEHAPVNKVVATSFTS